MKKTGKSRMWLILTIPVMVLLVLYLLLTAYYQNRFGFGVWINGEYCTGKSVAEVNSLLLKNAALPKIQITEPDGSIECISLENAECQMDYTAHLQEFLNEQSSFGWIFGLGSVKEKRLTPSITFDRKCLEDEISALALIKRGMNASPPEVKIQKTAAGYVLKQNLEPVPDVEKITGMLLSRIEEGQADIVISEDCYMEQSLTDEMQKTLALWDKINTLQNCGIIYDMGDTQVPIDAAVVADWIAVDEDGQILTDEDGNPMLSENCFKEFVNRLAEEYDTYNVPREFRATRGDIITIEKGTYGNKLNRDAETAYLEEAFKAGVEEVHTPVYEKEALYKGKDDIGDTYIEVDMTEQTMYYYVKGELFLETPVVTGNVSAGHRTPSRICSVYLKQTDRILRGPGYESPVDYWMPVYGSIGIHDASWRNKFGGEIYKTNGSHGCINTPYEAMRTLYENVEVGTPVIMFY